MQCYDFSYNITLISIKHFTVCLSLAFLSNNLARFLVLKAFIVEILMIIFRESNFYRGILYFLAYRYSADIL